MPEFDVDALRARFPALSIEQDGRPVALFDGPGGTQVPDTVIEAVARYYRESNANHEGPFLTSSAATRSSTTPTLPWPTCSTPPTRRRSSSAPT